MKKLLLILFALALAVFGLVANNRLPVGQAAPPPSEAAAPAEQSAPAPAAESGEAGPAAAPTESAEPDKAPGESANLAPVKLVEYSGRLQITELMTKNKAAVADGFGGFPDWAELENISDKPVSLAGWSLSDREGQARWSFSDGELAPGERLLVLFDGKNGPAFSLTQGETLYLLSPDGFARDQVFCSSDHADRSLIRGEDDSFTETVWATPGYENSREGYEAWSQSRSAGGLVIYEAAVYNNSYTPKGMDEPCDWLEIKNVSEEPISLAGFTLSDKSSVNRWTFPNRELGPGEILLICCHDDEEGSIGSALNTGFNLRADEEQLYLRDSGGRLLDWVSLHDIPIGGSMGRMDGENGFFFFSRPSPGTDNTGGRRRISALPTSLEPDGIYDDVEQVEVALSAGGEIHYTLDGTVPTADSPLYTDPIIVRSTTLVRAISIEDDALPSRPATLSYIINEHHTLPVLSIAVDDANRFNIMYTNGWRVWSVPGNLALYDGGCVFSRQCDVAVRGWTSLELPKKSFGVAFRGRYGGNLECDLFSNGITEFSDLAIRGGQDYTFSIFRNELFEDLCLDADAACLTQASRYCILYVDGQYYGIYALKEDFSKQYYASHMGVSVDSVTKEKFPVDYYSEVQTRIINPSWHDDFSRDEIYQGIADQIDVDSLVDWFLLESFSANTDIQGNVRLYRSTELGNRWTFCFYDLDWAFYYPGSCFGAIIADRGNSGAQIPPLLRAMIRNPDFRERCLLRFAELIDGPLSNEHVLERIDAYQALLEPEVPRDRTRWRLSTDQWYTRIEELRSFVIDKDWENYCIDQICYYLKVGEMERQQIFGR